MPVNFAALEHPRGCDTGRAYVNPGQLFHRRDYGHYYHRAYYPNHGKYNEGGSLASFARTADYEYGCP